MPKPRRLGKSADQVLLLADASRFRFRRDLDIDGNPQIRASRTIGDRNFRPDRSRRALPVFLPWCADAVILARDDKEVAAESRSTFTASALR